ncbi:hypothetical protein J2Z21_009616 [Streptomyces griseochromogenes]|uniref:Uncharacterized protein n=1 Tax=Streptomyces griseochromogenes TaxID=68214 RepID=A0ABS4MB01_9ACTN|nr:hypothetical protein [Streptomyces griseochromogenes]
MSHEPSGRPFPTARSAWEGNGAKAAPAPTGTSTILRTRGNGFAGRGTESPYGEHSSHATPLTRWWGLRGMVTTVTAAIPLPQAGVAEVRIRDVLRADVVHRGRPPDSSPTEAEPARPVTTRPEGHHLPDRRPQQCRSALSIDQVSVFQRLLIVRDAGDDGTEVLAEDVGKGGDLLGLTLAGLGEPVTQREFRNRRAAAEGGRGTGLPLGRPAPTRSAATPVSASRRSYLLRTAPRRRRCCPTQTAEQGN